MNRVVVFGSAIVLTSAFVSQSLGASPLQYKKNDDGIWFYEHHDPVFFYQIAHKSRNGNYRRANYIHPLYGMTGDVITEDFPADHLHHRGIFWAWHQVRVDGKNIGDNWTCREFNWNVTHSKVMRCGQAMDLLTHVTWSSSALLDDQNDPQPIIQETTRIRIHRKCKSYRVIDFKIGLTAIQENVTMGGSENDKGYGGFSARVRIPPDVQFIGNKGRIEPQRTAVDAGPWVNMVGEFETGNGEGFAIISHPNNPGYPEPWILRTRGSMQNAKYPGQHAIRVGRGEEAWTLRYRLVIHRCGDDTALLNRLHRQFIRGSL